MIRRLAAALAAIALLLALAAPALAGGWADVVADAQTVEPPVEGKPLVVGFRVLQHGETPAPWETATVHFTNTSTGKTMDVVATNDRADGHFTATATLPEAGYWSWQVTLQDLVSEHMPVTFAVSTAGGELPTYDPATTATAIAQAKKDVTRGAEHAVPGRDPAARRPARRPAGPDRPPARPDRRDHRRARRARDAPGRGRGSRWAAAPRRSSRWRSSPARRPGSRCRGSPAGRARRSRSAQLREEPTRRDLLVEEAAEPRDPLGRRGRLHPSTERALRLRRRRRRTSARAGAR